MVPEGWKSSTLGNIAQITSGGTPSKSEPRYWTNGSIPWIRTTEIQNCHLSPLDVQVFITEEGLKNSSAKLLPKGTILLAMIGQGKTRGQVALLHFKATTNQNSAAIILKSGYEAEFYYNFLRSRYKQIRSASNSAGQSNLSGALVKLIKVPVPPFPEQKKIAQILSTWDQAITATERLLANSQQRKKGLMQQLLTGKKRLPGFEGDWRKIELGDALDYQQPTPFLVKSTEYSDDFPTPVLTAGKSFLLGYTDEKFGIYYEGLPVIIFDDFTTASQFVDFPFKAKSSAMKILTAKPGYSIRFIFEAMRMIRFAVGGHQRHWISIFANLVIPCPNSEEQQAISEVFATADREIASLQARLDSLKSEKKALMQQLLTGKRRVNVETEAA